MPTLSVIIPVYNDADSIGKCLDSISAQTFTDFEVIVVNDGSDDNGRTKATCDECALRDKRIKVLERPHRGVSETRNSGLDEAVGEFVTFIDADDFVENDFFEKGLRFMVNEKLDLVTTDLILETLPISSQDARKKRQDKVFFDADGFAEYFLDYNIFCIGGKLFRRSLINQSALRFDPSLRRGEDTLFVKEFIAVCNRIGYLSYAGYYYLQSRTSQTIYPFEHNFHRIKCAKANLEKFAQRFPGVRFEKLIQEIAKLNYLAIHSCVCYKSKTTAEFRENMLQLDLNLFLVYARPRGFLHRQLLKLLKHRHFGMYRRLMRLALRHRGEM